MIWDNFSFFWNKLRPAVHARTCCEDFCRCRAREMTSEIPEIYFVFGPQLNAFISVGSVQAREKTLGTRLGSVLKVFRRKLL